MNNYISFSERSKALEQWNDYWVNKIVETDPFHGDPADWISWNRPQWYIGEFMRELIKCDVWIYPQEVADREFVTKGRFFKKKKMITKNRRFELNIRFEYLKYESKYSYQIKALNGQDAIFFMTFIKEIEESLIYRINKRNHGEEVRENNMRDFKAKSEAFKGG